MFTVVNSLHALLVLVTHTPTTSVSVQSTFTFTLALILYPALLPVLPVIVTLFTDGALVSSIIVSLLWSVNSLTLPAKSFMKAYIFFSPSSSLVIVYSFVHSLFLLSLLYLGLVLRYFLKL